MPIFGNNNNSQFNTENPTAPKKKKTGSGFTNLQKIIGASSGQRMGQAIGQGVTGQAAGFKSQLEQEQQQFGQKLGEAQSTFDPAKRDQIISGAGTSGEPTEEQTNTFKKYLSGQLGADNLSGGLQGFGKLAGQASDLTQQAKDLTSQGGRYNLLQRYVSGGKAYNPGAKRLDAMVLGQGGAKELQQARTGLGSVPMELKQAQDAAQAQYGVAAGKVKDFAKQTGELLDTNIRDVDTAVDFKNKKAAVESLYGKSQDDIKKMFESGQIDQATADLIGLGQDQYLYDLDPLQLQQTLSLDPSKTQFASQFATKEQDARMRALSKLAGKDTTAWGGPDTAGQATSAITADKEKLKQLLAGKESDYQKQLLGQTGESIKGLSPSEARGQFIAESGRYGRELSEAPIDSNVQKQVNEAIAGGGDLNAAYGNLQTEIQKMARRKSDIQQKYTNSANVFTGNEFNMAPEDLAEMRRIDSSMPKIVNIANTMGSLRETGQMFRDWETKKRGKRVTRVQPK